MENSRPKYTLMKSDHDVEKGHRSQANLNQNFLLKCLRLPYRFRTCRRWWNRLSRLQRYILCIVFCFIPLCVIFVLPWFLDNIFQQDPGLRKNDFAYFFSISRDQKLMNMRNDQWPLVVQTDGISTANSQMENGLHLSEIVSKASEDVPNSYKDQRAAVVEAFRHAWRGYKRHAWGHDHLKPITKTFQDWFGLGLTIVDSLDTMYIMELEEEFNEAKEWVRDKLDFSINKDVNIFETTIRVLGGLLSAFHLSKEPVFLAKAIDLGRRLLPGFKSASGIPFSDINLQTGFAHPPSWSQDSSVSEVATLQLEFRDLSRVTDDKQYEIAAYNVSLHLHKLPKKNGLIPMFINAETGQFRTSSTITIGARADSYYEYLLKQWIQTGQSIEWLKEDYMEAVDGIMEHLVRKSKPKKLTFVGELLSGQSFSPKMDHLVCYLPGTLALGYHYGMPASHLQLALELMETCYNMYQTATHLSPEIAYFNLQPHGANDILIKSNDAHNLLRPESVESLWYLYHLTHNKTYREWGWTIFQAFEKHSKIKDGGYTSISDVRNVAVTKPRDFMESFFLAETLKYLYLLFSDDQEKYSIDRYVYNSEAHLLPIWTS